MLANLLFLIVAVAVNPCSHDDYLYSKQTEALRYEWSDAVVSAEAADARGESDDIVTGMWDYTATLERQADRMWEGVSPKCRKYIDDQKP